MAVAYNPYDTTQRTFLAALAQGESGGFSAPQSVGFGGSDLSSYSVDSYGFPQWQGVGNTHAAGTYQFQPGTWAEVASEHGLNFQNPTDQDAGAWYYAQDRYAQATGRDLQTALQTGDYGSVQTALKEEWPSVLGSASNPQGLSGLLSSGISTLTGKATDTAQQSSQPVGVFSTIENWFLRGGLIIVGLLIIGVALFFLLKGPVMKFAKGAI